MARTEIGSRRSAVEIIYEILSLCEGVGVKKTAIMYGSNLSHDQLVRYLSYLTDQGMIEARERRYRLTDAGRTMLTEVAEVIDLVRGLRGEEPSAKATA